MTGGRELRWDAWENFFISPLYIPITTRFRIAANNPVKENKLLGTWGYTWDVRSGIDTDFIIFHTCVFSRFKEEICCSMSIIIGPSSSTVVSAISFFITDFDPAFEFFGFGGISLKKCFNGEALISRSTKKDCQKISNQKKIKKNKKNDEKNVHTVLYA